MHGKLSYNAINSVRNSREHCLGSAIVACWIQTEAQNETKDGATVYKFRLVRTVHGYLCSPSSVIAATVQSCVWVKTAQFSRLHTTFYLQRLELCRQKVAQNVACGPTFSDDYVAGSLPSSVGVETSSRTQSTCCPPFPVYSLLSIAEAISSAVLPAVHVQVHPRFVNLTSRQLFWRFVNFFDVSSTFWRFVNFFDISSTFFCWRLT